MKKILTFLLVAGIVASCDGPDGTADGIPGLDDLGDILLSYDKEDDESVANLTFTAPDDWYITVEQTRTASQYVPAWLSIDPVQGGPGEAEVTVKVTDTNDDDDQRSVEATVTVGKKRYKTIRIVQHSRMTQAVYKLTLFGDTDDYVLNSWGHELTITAGCSNPITIEVEGEARKWLTLVDNNLDTNDGIYMLHRSVMVGENETGRRRTGVINIASGKETLKVTVTQYHRNEQEPQ